MGAADDHSGVAKLVVGSRQVNAFPGTTLSMPIGRKDNRIALRHRGGRLKN
jgi:hypothetical protein